MAAPVTRATMEAALATRATPLDRSALLRSASRADSRSSSFGSIAQFADQPIDPPLPPLAPGHRTWDGQPPVVAGRSEGVSLPDVRGLPARVAVRRLHALGLRVEHPLGTDIVGTVPPPGSRVLPGDTVRLRLRQRSND